jgi:uncharacterized coiled-coil protein SlyX
MSKHERMLTGLHQDAEKLLDELELILAKQEAQLKEMHICVTKNKPFSEKMAHSGDALIKESEALLETLSTTLAQQCEELSRQGIDIDKIYSTNHYRREALSAEKSQEYAERAKAYAKIKAQALSQEQSVATKKV